MLALILYFLGGLLVLLMFEPEEESGPLPLLLFCILWPAYTVYLAAMDVITKDQE